MSEKSTPESVTVKVRQVLVNLVHSRHALQCNMNCKDIVKI